MTVQVKKIACVTGATGLIGRHILWRLVGKGYFVRALSRKRQMPVDQVEWVQGDLMDGKVLTRFLQGASLVFHCAAELKNETTMWQVNVGGTTALLAAVTEEPVDFFCYLSSAGVVGKTDEILIDESVMCRPISEYERTKWEAECLVLQAKPAGRSVVLRPTNVVDETVPGIVLGAMRYSWTDRIGIFLKGAENAHLVYADDVAAAAVHLVDAQLCPGSVYFVSSDGEVDNTVAGIVKLCRGKYPTCLPKAVPYWLRRIRRGHSNRGDISFSSAKLLSTGFCFPTGLVGAVLKICKRTREGAL